MSKELEELESELVNEILKKFEEIGIDTSEWEYKFGDGNFAAEFIQAGIKDHLEKIATNPATGGESGEKVFDRHTEEMLREAYSHSWMMRERYNGPDRHGYEDKLPKNWYEMDYEEHQEWFFNQWLSKQNLPAATPATGQGMKWVKIDELITKIPDDADLQEPFVVDSGGSYQIEISKIEGKYVVTNAINGWGNNCRDDFANSEVLILTQINQSPQPDKEPLSKEALENHGFKFEEIGHNDFELLGTFVDENGIEVNWYNDNGYGIPYGTEGNVMDLHSIQELITLRDLLTNKYSK
jgi:hypothetical protein